MIRRDDTQGFDRFASVGTKQYFEQFGGKERITRFD